MRVIYPQGLVERLRDGHRPPRALDRYGREKHGSPKDAESLKIASRSDRRGRPRHDADPLRGRLFDVIA